MKLSGQRIRNWILLFGCSVTLFFSLGVNQLAQTTQNAPAPSGHVNDFAGVINEQARQQLENILVNLKLKTGIEFDVATVQSTGGQEISEFSLQLAKDWNVGARTSVRKSLLLVLAVTEKTSFTRFSKSVQSDLPEGVLGEMGQRMRALIDSGQFSEGLNAGVQHFVKSLGQKLAFSPDDFDKAPATVASTSPPANDQGTAKPTDQATPVLASSSTDVLPTTIKPTAVRSASATSKTRKPVAAPVDDEVDGLEARVEVARPEERLVRPGQARHGQIEDRLTNLSGRVQLEARRGKTAGRQHERTRQIGLRPACGVHHYTVEAAVAPLAA